VTWHFRLNIRAPRFSLYFCAFSWGAESSRVQCFGPRILSISHSQNVNVHLSARNQILAPQFIKSRRMKAKKEERCPKLRAGSPIR